MRTRISFQRWLCVAIVLCVSLGAVQAKTINVDLNGTGDYTTIAAAVNAAGSGDTIVIAPGTYLGEGSRNIVLSGKVLTIRSSDPDDPNVVAETVVDCYVDEVQKSKDMVEGLEVDGYRFIWMNPDTGAELTLVGLTIVNASDAFSGGAVSCESAKLVATDCIFVDNSVVQWGGVVYCSSAEASFDNCSFVGNTSTQGGGGALYCEDSVVSLSHCDFSGNSGNALRISNSDITLSQCTFEGNTGQFGGAIYCYVASDLTEDMDIVFDRCTFTGNKTQVSGGAICFQGGQPVIVGCTFKGNLAAERGGAIYNQQCSPSISNCAFIANKSSSLGGAVSNYISSAPEILNCTFVGNQAVNGGAVTSVRDSHPLISHCILWKNTATNGPNLYLAQDTYSRGPSKMTVEYSDLNEGSASIYVATGTTLTWGDGNITADPLFTQPANNIYRLSADSPCVDAGDPTYSPDQDAVDLDGYRRLFGDAVDMGAYEYQGLSPVYRFWSPVKGKHFYTILGAERDKLINRYPSVWTYEGVAYWAFYGPSEPDLTPVYRFWSPVLESHVWTTSEHEKEMLLTQYADVYQYEGIVFYAYTPGKQPLSTVPVYRFWSDRLGYHFYTMNEGERDKLISKYPDVWAYEGIVWYIHPRAYQLEETAYLLEGGADEVSYVMTLSAFVDGKEVAIDAPEVYLTPKAAEMEMVVGFAELTTTLKGISVRTLLTDHTATIDPKGAVIPFTLSAQATFNCATPQETFEVDPTTGVFADFRKAGQTLAVEGGLYSYNGQVTFSDRQVAVDSTAEALDFVLESYGLFECLDRLPTNVCISMPLTFQWTRAGVKDLLVDTSVKGYRVQLYVTSMSVGTLGQWVGQLQD